MTWPTGVGAKESVPLGVELVDIVEAVEVEGAVGAELEGAAPMVDDVGI